MAGDYTSGWVMRASDIPHPFLAQWVHLEVKYCRIVRGGELDGPMGAPSPGRGAGS